MKQFYENWIQKDFGHYLNLGQFVPSASKLYSNTEGTEGVHKTVPADKLSALGSSGATSDIYLVRLEKNVPQRIRMFVYLEGQDVDCVSYGDVSDLIVHVELAGSNLT